MTSNGSGGGSIDKSFRQEIPADAILWIQICEIWYQESLPFRFNNVELP